MPFGDISLDDKFLADTGRVYLTAMEALARLPLMQRRRDLGTSRNTACFISGYRGSPLGRLDSTLWAAGSYLSRHHVVFQPGVNEELATTAISGTQQTDIFADAAYDGVFALWYGKGPGVDRAGDALRHAQFAGTARYGGVLMAVGDDQGAQSSTIPQYSEHALRAYHIPVLYPATVEEIVTYGLAGWDMSRFAGVWVAMKLVADLADAGQPVDFGAGIPAFIRPDAPIAPGGMHIRWPDPVLHQQERLWRFRLPAVQAYVRANRLDRVTLSSSRKRLGIVAAGKAHQDVRQALLDLGIGAPEAEALGLSIYKPALIWPLDGGAARAFASGFEEILVVDEGAGSLEIQIRDALYGLPADRRPRVIGKSDDGGSHPLPLYGEITPTLAARVIAGRLGATLPDAARRRLALYDAREAAVSAPGRAASGAPVRTPYFCSGCPHNSSTRVPEGSRAYAGIGCHVMALNMDRATRTWTQMGGEGMTWCGLAPFSKTRHAFVNLGDGTYYHSGYLAVRAAVASGANVTYKILYNDAVAMTGGQPVDGPLSPDAISRQVAAEGVGRIAVVTDYLEDLPPRATFAGISTFHQRDDLDAVQKELREWPGVSVLLYVQTCATEKRRRRKRGRLADPDKRVVINDRVCEGCGDCGVQSNCLSVIPLDTEYGRKRAIDQSACNKDFSCLKGFCPSFVTVEGGHLKHPSTDKDDMFAVRLSSLPVPELPETRKPYAIVLAGIGGTGVVTASSILAVAAYLEGKAVSQLDLTGMAQKFGSVTSHVWIANTQSDIGSTQIAEADADLVLGPDILTAASPQNIALYRPGKTRAVINGYEQMTGDFTRKEDFALPRDALMHDLTVSCGDGNVAALDATRLSAALLGDAIGANMILLGYAFQSGLVPVSEAALFKAIDFNGVARSFNKDAFGWGRLAAADPDFVESRAAARHPPADSRRLSETFADMVARRADDLTRYHNAAYSERYRKLVRRAEKAEISRTSGRAGFKEAVARYAYKLMAFKDEYEVARLYTDGTFLAGIRSQFEGAPRLVLHLAPPILGEKDEHGVAKKRAFGPWMLRTMSLLARFRRLRFTPFDPFGYTAERKMERRLIAEYEDIIGELCANLDQENFDLAVEIASIPEAIRGFGHIKERHRADAKSREAELLRRFRSPAPRRDAAE